MPVATTRGYRVAISWDEFDHDFIYRYSEWYDMGHGINNRDTAIASAEKNYGADSRNSAVSYKIEEKTTITTTDVDISEDEVVTETTTVVVRTEVFCTRYRKLAEYTQSVLVPRRAAEQRRVDSGEAALEEAYLQEIEDNTKRHSNNEAMVYTATIAYFNFKDMEIPTYMVPPVVTPKQKNLIKKVLRLK